MRLVDELDIKVCSGKGGDGIVSWLRLKYIPKGGPAGGDGGSGGDVYVQAVDDIEALRRYVGIRHISAEDGMPGQSKKKHGIKGEDLILKFPVGSVIRFDNKEIDLQKVGETVKILDGGRGGLGNTHFKSSRNTSPKRHTLGKPAHCVDLHVELQLIADVGIIGMPNAGKSTLLNFLSNSKAKTADYPFTTTEPNLGVVDSLVFADIPGLVEGAAEGKGLGHKFLKHISRTRILLHMISAEHKNPCRAYSLTRDEMFKYDNTLTRKPEILVMSKIDTVNKEELSKRIQLLDKCSGKKVIPVTMNENKLVNSLKSLCIDLFNKLD